jgi:hypothetical protein
VPKTVEDFFRRMVQEVVKYREEHSVVRGDYLQYLISLKNKASNREIINGQDVAIQKDSKYGLMSVISFGICE